MWKYVSRRVKDSIELGINVRKSFTVQQHLNNVNTQNPRRQQQQNASAQHHLNLHLIPRYQDPSRDKDKSDEKFKRKYHRLNNKNKCFLSALTWVSSLALKTLLPFPNASLVKTVNSYRDRLLCIAASVLVPSKAEARTRRRTMLLFKISSINNTDDSSQCTVSLNSRGTAVTYSFASFASKIGMSIQESKASSRARTSV